jgi:hypothetical protein
MKWLVFLGVLLVGYMFMLSKTVDIVADQTKGITAIYRTAAEHPERITGLPSGE